MSTKAIREALNELEEWRKDNGHDKGIAVDALAEVEAIERAAKAMTELHAGDFIYNIRDRFVGDHEYMGDSWEHPAVKAWSDAGVLLADIAKQEP